MTPQDPVLVLLREHAAGILLGAVFVFVGLAACLIAALRRRSQFTLLVYVGLFIGMYGARMLADAAIDLNLFPGSLWPARIQLVVQFLLDIPAFLFWIELSKGVLRRFFQGLTLASSIIAAVGLAWYFISGSRYTFLRYNLLLAISGIVVIGVLVTVPGVARKYLVIQSWALRIVMPALAAVTLYVNLMWFFGVPPAPSVEPLAFAAWIFAIGFEAAKNTFDKERRLFSIESELETARQIQSSILPDCAPIVAGLQIAATYRPMSAVAGDFYQFLQMDEHRVGILIADVTGHGVPAALIASMIKVAMQSGAGFAAQPAQVMASLNRILTPELRGRLTSAAYLWIDANEKIAHLSAAGHPPLLHWKPAEGVLRRIESNGLLFGVMTRAEYPVQSIQLNAGDRLLLYTDGLVEPENALGEAFGDRQLEEVVRGNSDQPAAQLSERLLSALRSWHSASSTQQDDITLVVVDVT